MILADTSWVSTLPPLWFEVENIMHAVLQCAKNSFRMTAFAACATAVIGAGGCREQAIGSLVPHEIMHASLIHEFGTLDGPAALGQVSDFAIDDASGDVLVAERNTLKLFDETGTFKRILGRPGAGPGEFQFAAWAGRRANAWWVYDHSLRRLTVLDDSGTAEVASTITGSVDGSFLPLKDGFVVMPSPTNPRGGVLDEVPVMRTDNRGIVTDTLFHLKFRRQVMVPLTMHDGVMLVTQPLPDRTVFAPGPSGEWLLVVNTDPPAEQSAVFLTAISMAGDTLWEHSFLSRSSRIPASLFERYAEATRTTHAGLDHSAEYVIDRVREQAPLPEFFPAVDLAVINSNGAVWLRTGGDRSSPTRKWISFDHASGRTRTFELPGELHVRYAKRDTLWGKTGDSLGVPKIQQYVLRKQGVQ